MSKIKNGGLDHYGAEPLEQQQFGAAGAEGVKAGHICIPTCVVVTSFAFMPSALLACSSVDLRILTLSVSS